MALLVSDRRRLLEISAVVLTGAGKFVFMDRLEWKLPFILIAIVCWGTYMFTRQSQLPGIMQYWGFRSDNFWQVSKIVLPFGIVSVVALIVIGFYMGTINITWRIIPILILYPVWGTVQQFLVIGLVAGNLKELKQIRLPDFFIVFVTALFFGIVHYPFYWLIVGTFVLALFYGYVYLRARNVYVMGIFHGWLGAIFFYTVVGRDPFTEVFGRILPSL